MFPKEPNDQRRRPHGRFRWDHVQLVTSDGDGRDDAVADAAALDSVLLDRHPPADPFEVCADALNVHVSFRCEAFQTHGAFENQHGNHRSLSCD